MLPRVQVHHQPVPAPGPRSVLRLQRPQLVEGFARIGAHRLPRILLREEHRGKHDFDALEIGLGLRADVGPQPIHQPRFVHRRPGLAEPSPQCRTCEQVGHARMAGDARPLRRCRRFPCEPLLQPPIEIPRRTLGTPPIADGDDRSQCEGEAGEKEKASIHGNSLSASFENAAFIQVYADYRSAAASRPTFEVSDSRAFERYNQERPIRPRDERPRRRLRAGITYTIRPRVGVVIGS